MWQDDFQYYVEFRSPDGECMGDAALEVDWVPAIRCAEFQQDVLNDRAAGDRSADRIIEPVWSMQDNRPYVSSVSVRREVEDDDSVDFPLSYFSTAVIAASAQMVTSGVMVAGQPFDYRIYALARSRIQNRQASDIGIVAVDEDPVIERTAIAPLLAESESHAGHTAAPGSAAVVPAATGGPVFLPQWVFDEATILAQGAGNIETGGILVGRLCRDPNGTFFSRVTAQIPAQHTSATQRSLRFTHETWVDVDAAIELRGKAEVALGWWHSHPFFCRRCTAEQQAICPFSSPSFSAADRDLHREVFQKPWSIALLLSFLGDERPSYDLFAWNQGQITATNFLTLPYPAATRENNHGR